MSAETQPRDAGTPYTVLPPTHGGTLATTSDLEGMIPKALVVEALAGIDPDVSTLGAISTALKNLRQALEDSNA